MAYEGGGDVRRVYRFIGNLPRIYLESNLRLCANKRVLSQKRSDQFSDKDTHAKAFQP